MKKYKLGDIATVEISGVDKKITDGEKEIRLCNFVDVYYNWAITIAQHDSFMLATARPNEISKFQLKKGQVALTKDSETRDDIGISTYIADDFEDVILGYHCALISPNKDILDGRYLNALLHTNYAKKYFACNASGSGQRYALSVEALNSFPVPIIPLHEQKQIGEIFSALDKKIELNRQINQNLEAMAKLLYDYWFVQFDFPNEEGKPYKSSGGEMVWNEKLKRMIPKEWINTNIYQLASISKETVNPQARPNELFKHYSLPEYDKTGTYAEEYGIDIHSAKFTVTNNCILVSKLNPWTSRVICGNRESNQICSTEFVVWNPASIKTKGFLFMLAKSAKFIEYCTQGTTGTSHSHRRINPELMMKFDFPYNSEIAIKFSLLIENIIGQLHDNIAQLKVLTKQRDELLPLLMNGQITIE
ncbi:restriction endonuclease subunit S [Bacteroides fragilis]|uniref:restriction endonuclease subunit S n=1 Tax=Bacteroides TaxID=816 RepID=UPI001FBBFEB2|nr:restriction endonuclease subunit S [Bacteroides fragilis]MCS2222461.1 restriction endonuclease subunit S [Bacteroides fragilis]MCY6345836.1 restriction endonuclease subunit S [Bacteroides fragilis]